MARFLVPLHPSWRRLALVVSLIVLAADVLPAAPVSAREQTRDSRRRFRMEMPKTVRADHPEIVPVAEAIRAISRDPAEQLVIVHHVTLLLVEYDSDRAVYRTKDYHATLDEMIRRRDEAGWRYLRDDCDGRAVYAAHLLAALGLPWNLEVSYWKRHAWVSAEAGGVRYDLLDLRPTDPELQYRAYRWVGHRLVRESRRPPEFNWRRAWAERTGGNVEIGVRLGLLTPNSRPGETEERFAQNLLVRRGRGGEGLGGKL